MIELLIVACLGQAPCREFSLLFDPMEVSIMTCTLHGQTQIASWKETHPNWTVSKWKCIFASEGETDA